MGWWGLDVTIHARFLMKGIDWPGWMFHSWTHVDDVSGMLAVGCLDVGGT